MRNRARTTHGLIQRNSGWIVIVLALVMAFVLAWASYSDRRVTTCQTRYNEDVSVALKERSKYAEEDRASLVEFVTSVQRAKSREERSGALDNYLETQREIDKRRSENPIPTLTPGRCGDE